MALTVKFQDCMGRSMDDAYKKYQGKKKTGTPDRSNPVPVSRLAPPIELVDLEKEIERANLLLNTRLSAKLSVIADQIRALQHEARKVLDETKNDQNLHLVRCAFKRRPGQIYHLYRHSNGSLYFSMLSPEDWHGNPPHPYEGSFLLEADMSWTPSDRVGDQDDTSELLRRFLADSKDDR